MRDIKAILDTEITNALGESGGDLQENRVQALKYYRGDLRGDEIEGRSKVISTDIADAIEWLMPSIVKTFVQTDEVVRFDPMSQEDEDQAEQESDYVNYVVTKENDAFLIFNSWFRDALLQKNGVVKTYWEDAVREREEYEGLTPDEVQILSQEPVEIIEVNPNEMGLLDVILFRETTPGQVKIVPVPPEEILINGDHNSLDLSKARFVAHERLMPASDLIEMGFDEKVVDGLSPHDYDGDEDAYTRKAYEDEYDNDSGDWSMRQIRVYECYIRVDINEDGIAELRKYIYASNTILSEEDVDTIPFAAITPILQPHSYMGRSIYDRLKQIQDQKTTVWRQTFDNMYLTNNQRTIVKSSLVNMEDLLTSRPGGVIRVKREAPSIMDAVQPLPVQPMGAQAFQMMDYLDKVREERVGVGANMMGQNINVAGDTAHGIERIMTAKEELVGLIIRTFAETGVKKMFLQVRELLMKHQDKAKVIKLRGKWIPVNPCDWKLRMNSTIKVGLGTGDQMKQKATLQKVLEVQKELMIGGLANKLVTEKNVYNALEDFGKAGGLKDVDEYFLDPDSEEAMRLKQHAEQNKKTPFDQQILMIEAQTAQQKAKNDAQKIQLEMQKMNIDIEKAKQSIRQKDFELQIKQQGTQSETQKEFIGSEIERAKLSAQIAQKDKELDLKKKELELEYHKEIVKAPTIGEEMMPVMESIQQVMKTMNAPKTILRDNEGNIIGVSNGEH